MINNPLFSVLIANYNNGLFIAKALESVFRQDYENWEVIIVDDASTDDSVNIIQPFLFDTRIKLFRNEHNMGCGNTKGRCAEFAVGEICGFLDPDDSLLPDALSLMVKEHLQNHEYSIIYSNHFICDEKLENPIKASKTGAMVKGYSYLINPANKSIHHFASFKRSFYDQTEGISSHLKKAVDQDLYYRLEEIGPVKYVDICLYNYRIHNNGISSTGKNAKAAALIHHELRLSTFERRKSNKQLSSLYPKDTSLSNYQIARSKMYFNKLSGKYFIASVFFIKLFVLNPIQALKHFVFRK